ncbi:nuclear pore complex protein Nup98-Nup96-like [Mercenaria mercenaria]|uniref:nuclear pore complex protein Nup98-Nup96-like n=1 Tax=Mercenaria mercenaria TaxID=6596 RepID=UPI00234F6A7B|nr:nuclear pore complex protein Nup98-Nup96-like [Mercenaria mercenaria]
MFGGSKPTGFGTPFAANASATPGFGGTAFGQATPTAGGGLFGQSTTGTGTGTGLFGGSGGSAFGTQSSGFNFGATPSSTGGLFGPKTTASTGLFGTPAAASTSNAFGFGSAAGGFGATTTTSSTAGGLFGTTNNAGTGLFGASPAFSQQPQAGTAIKFNPPQGQDTMVKNGVTQNINTKHQCITAMKEYEGKSLEELRVEDYTAGRKGKQAGTTSGFGFGTPAASATQPTGFAFAQAKPSGFGASTGFGTNTSTGTSNLFGQPTAQASTGGGLFGQNKPLFGNTTTTTQSGFGFGTQTSTGTGGLFGQATQNKPLFGATTTTQPSLFGTGANTFGQTAASSGFGGFGTSQAGGLFATKPAFGAQTTSTGGFGGFGTNSNTGANLFAKPFSTPSTGFGFNTATTSSGFGGTQPFGAAKPTGFSLATTSAAPAFNFTGGMSAGTSMFGNPLNKPGGLGAFGSAAPTGFGTFSSATSGLGSTVPTLGGTANQSAVNQAVQLQQTLQALTNSPYGDSPLFWNMKESKTKREDVLKPTNPVAQKAILANQHKVSPRPMAKIRPKALSGALNGNKSQIFEGLEEDDFSFGSDTFQPRKSVKKLTIKKVGQDSSNPSRASSMSGEPPNMSSLREEENFRGRSSPVAYNEQRRQEADVPETENIIRSKGISDQMDTPDRRPNMDDTIAMLNAQNKSSSAREPVSSSTREPVNSGPSQDDTVNISIISRDESVNDDVIIDERPMTPPPPHPAGIVLSRPGYYTIPSQEALSEMVDEDGNCFVEDFTIGREGYGSIFFPGMTNIANMNFDETVFFRRKEVIVYPDDDNKPEVGEGLNKRAEITLDCVWPRDKSIGTPIKSPEKLKAMRWQDKIEENSLKVGAKFIDYRPETGSWVFEVKHFSKYGLVDDSDEEDMPEQDKKRLRLAQQQQMAVQKQKLNLEHLEKQKQQGALKVGATNGHAKPGGHLAKFTVGTDEESDGSGTARTEVPMGDDDNQISEASQGGTSELAGELDDEDMDVPDEQPSSHRLATSMGVDARNMQVMKASFFGDEDAPAPAFDGSMFAKKQGPPTGSPLLRHGDGPSLFSSSLKSKYMSPVKIANIPQKETTKDRGLFSPRLITPEPIRATKSPQTYHPPVKEYMLLESGMTQQDYQQRVVGSRVQKVIPMVTESFTYNKQALLVDAGLFMGRSFRVGWGPGWTLAHCGDIVQPEDLEEDKPTNTFSLFTGGQKRSTKQAETSWIVHLQKINIADHIQSADKTVIQNHREMLEIQLVHSRSTKEGNCPVFTPSLGVEALHQYAERNQDELETLGSHPDESSVKHMGMVWDLCVALWGNMPEFKDMEIERDTYLYHNARREAFSRWLSSVSGEIIRKEVQESKYKDQGHLEAILSCLTGHQVTEACNLAQKAGDHRLALILAQSVSNYIPRQMVSKQLDELIELGVDNFFKETRLKIYSLLAGQLVLPCNNMTVNTCDGMDWKRSLALHLWFCCQAEAPIQEAVELYERAFKGTNENQQYSRPPLPPYLEAEVMEEVEVSVRDTCYHILCLYCQKCHQLERLLNPTTSTSSHLDYRLSWHLSQVLQSLSYNHLSAYHRASLHMNFAAHLESLDLWEWAVFVALHIENPISRESAVRSILNRHIQLSSSESYLEKEELLNERLLVPVEWIHSAKALRANYESKHKEEAWHLLKAGQWNKSHDVIMRHIAPDAIIHERYEYLHEFLAELSIPVRSATILDWHIAGSVYLEYINISNSMKQLSKAGEPSLYELDRLLPEVKSLCTKVGSIPCRNSKDRLCQSEMAKKAANFLRLILTFQAEANGEPQPPMRLLAPYISNLPMPEDYTLHELRALTRSYMMEQTVS